MKWSYVFLVLGLVNLLPGCYWLSPPHLLTQTEEKVYIAQQHYLDWELYKSMDEDKFLVMYDSSKGMSDNSNRPYIKKRENDYYLLGAEGCLLPIAKIYFKNRKLDKIEYYEQTTSNWTGYEWREVEPILDIWSEKDVLLLVVNDDIDAKEIMSDLTKLLEDSYEYVSGFKKILGFFEVVFWSGPMINNHRPESGEMKVYPKIHKSDKTKITIYGYGAHYESFIKKCLQKLRYLRKYEYP